MKMTVNQKKIILYTTAIVNEPTEEADNVSHGNDHLLVPNVLALAKTCKVLQAESPYGSLVHEGYLPHRECA